MSATDLPRPAPTVIPDTAPYWSAAAAGRLVLPRCDDCGVVIWYPRPHCPKCFSQHVTWEQMSGNGTIYTFTVTRRGVEDYKSCTPYILAYVELEEGPRVLTNVVDCDVETVRVGDRVTAVFHNTGDEAALLRFRPAD